MCGRHSPPRQRSVAQSACLRRPSDLASLRAIVPGQKGLNRPMLGAIVRDSRGSVEVLSAILAREARRFLP